MNSLTQNTPEWHQMRKNKIGASDAPVIMGNSPWKTPYKLWEEKLNLSSTPTTPSMRRGHDLEEKARRELEKMTDLFFLPQVKFHADISWMMASLDAIDVEGQYIAEIKCPNREDHQCALNGNIPEKYFAQLQHQLEVCQLEMGYYFSFDGVGGVIVKVYRDDAYIKKLIKKEEEFWECLQSLHPPQMTENDFECKKDDLWHSKSEEWKTVASQLKELEKKERELRESLIFLSQNRNSMGNGIKVSKAFRKGSVDYSSIPELQEIDLEIYRKTPIEYWKISSS